VPAIPDITLAGQPRAARALERTGDRCCVAGDDCFKFTLRRTQVDAAVMSIQVGVATCTQVGRTNCERSVGLRDCQCPQAPWQPVVFTYMPHPVTRSRDVYHIYHSGGSRGGSRGSGPPPPFHSCNIFTAHFVHL